MFAWSANGDDIADNDWNAAPDDEGSTALESVGTVDNCEKGDGSNDVDWDRHVVDVKICIPGRCQ